MTPLTDSEIAEMVKRLRELAKQHSFMAEAADHIERIHAQRANSAPLTTEELDELDRLDRETFSEHVELTSYGPVGMTTDLLQRFNRVRDGREKLWLTVPRLLQAARDANRLRATVEILGKLIHDEIGPARLLELGWKVDATAPDEAGGRG